MSETKARPDGGLPIPDYWTIKQAAPIAGMSVWQLYVRLKRPDGPPHDRRGKFILFPKQKFQEWANQSVIL